jgi:autotransporter-associated beta strand protein
MVFSKRLRRQALPLLTICACLLAASQADSQTLPALFDLSTGNYSFNEWAATEPAETYPANMRFWRHGTVDPLLTSALTGDYTGAYNGSSGTRINGLGPDGLAWTNITTAGNLGAAVVGLNTLGRNNIQVSWTGGVVATGDRQYAITLQYRVGAAGDWISLSPSSQYLSDGNPAGHSANLGPVTLPSVCNDKPAVYLLWRYHYVGPATGSRPRMRLDDITVTSTQDTTPAAIAEDPQSITIPSGTATTLSVVASGPTLTYQWYQGAPPDTSTPVGTNSASFTTPDLTVSTSYWVRVSNPFGIADSGTALVSVSNLPSVVAVTPEDGAVNVAVESPIVIEFNKPVSLTAGAVTVMTGLDSVALTGLPVTDQTTVTLTPSSPLDYGTSYDVTVIAAEVTDADSDTPAADTEFSFTTVAAQAPVFTAQPQSQTLAAGDPATLTVTVTGVPTPTLQWYQGVSGDESNLVTGETGTSLELAAVNASALYWVKATNLAGSVNSQAALLSVPGPFTEGNLLVRRMGDGLASLSSAATAVALVEVTPQGVPVQILTAQFEGEHLLTDSGSSTAAGHIFSYNGRLAVPGYNAVLGTASVDGTNTKVVNQFGAGGTVVDRTLFPTDGSVYTGAFRSVAPDGNGGFYTGGTGAAASAGVWYFNGSTFTRITIGSDLINIRNVGIYGDRLFFSTAAGTQGVYTFDAGLPTSATVANLVLPVTNPNAFYFVSTGAQGPGVLDRAWVASDSSTANTGGLVRFDFDGSTWTKTYGRRIDPATANLLLDDVAAPTGSLIRGLTGTWDADTGTATLYATTNQTNNNRLVKVVDSGATPTEYELLANAGVNMAFRGVAFAPEVIPPVAPELVGTTPVDGATGVAPSTGITLNFSEPVTLTADAVTIEAPLGTPIAFTGLPVATPTSTVVLMPDADLPMGTVVTVTVVADEVTDVNDGLNMDQNEVFAFTTTAVPPLPDLTVNVSAPVAALVGASFAYTIQLSNVGTAPATGVEFGFTTPPGTTITNLVSNGGAGNFEVSVVAGAFVVSDGSLAVGQTVTLTMTVVASSAGTVTLAAGSWVIDPDDTVVESNEANNGNPVEVVTVVSEPPPDLVVVTGNGLYEQNFTSMGTATPLAWKAFKVAGTNATAIGAFVNLTQGTGSSGTGAVYSFGLEGNPDRALGVVASGGFIGGFGVTLRNDTGVVLSGENIKLGFTAEQWRSSTAATLESLEFEWKIGGDINGTVAGVFERASWARVPAFDIVETDTSSPATSGALNGNLPANRTEVLPALISAIGEWMPGEVLHLRWIDVDNAGTDAGLAIDDVSIEFVDVPPVPVFAYWDANGAAPGAGGPAPGGTWGVDAFWSASVEGTAATTEWSPGEDAVFVAAADAMGPFTVTVDGTQLASSITVNAGELTLTGGTIELNGRSVIETIDSFALVQSALSGSEGLRKRGNGALELAGVNAFSGAVNIAAGSLWISADAALGNPANEIRFAGGWLRAAADLTLDAGRVLSGAARIETAPDALLTVAGPMSMSSLRVAGQIALTNQMIEIGALRMTAGSLSGMPIAGLTGILAEPFEGTVTISNDLDFGLSSRTVEVVEDAVLDLRGSLALGGGVNNALNKLGAGKLIIRGNQPDLNKVSLGIQGSVPLAGGTLAIDSAGGLGATVMFFNNGTLEVLEPLTGANALQIGASIGGREGGEAVIEGAPLEFAGESRLFGAAGTAGEVVILVHNETTFSGAFDPAAASANIDGVRFGGSGLVRFSGNKGMFSRSVRLVDTVTFDLSTDALGSAAATGVPVLRMGAGTSLVVGGSDSTRLITVAGGLEAGAGSQLHFELAGTNKGAGYDSLDFAQTAGGAAPLQITGQIRVGLIHGFVPSAGQAFQLMRWPSTFAADVASASFDLPALPEPLVWDTSLFAGTGTIFVTAPGAGPVILAQPQGGAFDPGTPVTLSVQAGGEGPLSHTWLRNGQEFGAPNSPTLALGPVGAAQMAVYSVVVSNADGATQSEPAVVLVNGAAPVILSQPGNVFADAGTPVSFSVVAIGAGTLSYQWQFNEVNVGGNSPTLDVVAGPDTFGQYKVVVSIGAQSTESAVAILSPASGLEPNQRPEWPSADLPPLPDARIGVPYGPETVAVLPDDPLNDVFRSATSFRATGLPPGLVINDNGEISGTPTAFRASVYRVSITARNSFGAATARTTILVLPLDDGFQGRYTGLVSRSRILNAETPADLNGNLGGRIDLNLPGNGRATGRVTIGRRGFAYRGNAVVTGPDTLRIEAEIRRGRVLSPLLLVMDVNSSSGTLSGTVRDQPSAGGAAVSHLEGWRTPWSRLNRPDSLAGGRSLAGQYTGLLRLQDASLNIEQAPQGSGYYFFTINPANGRVSVRGRVADGTPFVAATVVGQGGQVLVFRPLYAARVSGSVAGKLEIEATANPADNNIGGLVTWSRPPNPARNNRLYQDGFPTSAEADAPLNTVVLVSSGLVYRRPARNERVLGLTDDADQIEVVFSGGGVETAQPAQPRTIGTVRGNNAVLFAAEDNPRRVQVRIAAGTGEFTASARLEDENPVNPGGPPVRRVLVVRGALVGDAGEGYIILNQLPEDEGDTPGNTRQLGGMVTIEPVPVGPVVE